MAKRGRKATPTRLKVLRGNPGKRPLNKAEPAPAGGLPPCPPHLAGAAAETWESFARWLTESKIAGDLDAPALGMLCASYALYLDALANVQKYGPVWMEKGAGKIPKFAYSPHWAVMNREWKNVISILREFGMTPSSRSSVTKAGPEVDRNPFAAYLQKA